MVARGKRLWMREANDPLWWALHQSVTETMDDYRFIDLEPEENDRTLNRRIQRAKGRQDYEQPSV